MESIALSQFNVYSNKFSSNYWKVILFFFGIVFTIAPGDDYNNALERSVELHKVLLQGIIFHEKFFSIFDILIILISFKLVKDFGLNFSNASFGEKTIWFFSVLSYIFLMINPNNHTNNPVLGMPLFTDVSNYSHLIFITTIFFLRYDEAFILLLNRFLRIILICILIWGTYLFILWTLGKGNYAFYNVNSILTEDDTLFVFAFAQTIFLLLFLLKKKKYYLIAWGFLFLIQVLSFRRSGFFVAALASFSLALLYFVKHVNLGKKIIAFFLVFLIASSFYGMFSNYNPTSNVQFYFYRFFGMFIPSSGTLSGADTDSGHFEHSAKVISEAFNKLGFWGIGYSEKPGNIIYETGIRGIHNAYVAMWFYRGIIGLLSIIVILLVFSWIILNFIKNLNKYPPEFLLIKSAVIFFFLYFLISIFYLSINHLIDIREIVLRTLIISFLFKVTPQNYNELIT